jgi:hypothetical protein
VLAALGRAAREDAGPGQPQGGRHAADFSEPRVLVGDGAVAGGDLRVLERVGDLVDAAARDAGRRQALEQRAGALGGEQRAQDPEQLVAVRQPVRDRREALVPSELGAVEDLAEGHPELLLGARDREPPIRGAERLERDDRRVRGLGEAGGAVVARRRPRGQVREQAERGLEQRRVAVAPASVAARAPQAGEQRDRGDVPAGVVDEREPGLRRRPVGLAGHAHPARHRLQHVVVRALGRPGPRAPEAAERAAHDPRVDLAERLVRQPEALGLVAAEVAEDAVGAAHERLERLAPGARAQVEGDAQLAAVEGLEEQ